MTERAWVGPASLVVLVLMIVATVGGVLVARGQLDDRLSEVAGSAVAGVRHDVQLNLQRDVAAAVGLARSLDDPTTIDAIAWRRAVEEVRRAGVFSAVGGVNLFTVVTATELGAVLDALPASVLPTLDLRLADGPVHAIGTAVWPARPNQPVLGYDLFSNPDAAPAAEAATRSGTVQGTRPTRVVQEFAEQRSTIVYVPVVADGVATGLISLVFRAEDLLTETVERLPDGASVRWVDTDPELPAGEGLLAEIGEPPAGGAVAVDELTHFGRRFEFTLALPRESLGSGERQTPVLVGALGLVLSVGLLVTIAAWRRTAHRADELVTQRTSALVAATAELEVANRELRELDHLKDRVLNTVSHDLRSPLSVIGGAAGLMLDRSDMPLDTQQDLLRRIRRQAARSRGMLDELLVAAQLRTGGVVADRRPVALAPLLAQVLGDLGIGELVHTDPKLPQVLADHVHVERILHNLLTNAAHHGRPPIEVSAVHGDGAGTVEVRVRDHGEGVPTELREQVFTEFGRAGTAGPGYGLGLAIVSELAHANGGWVGYREAEGPGACFVLALPAAGGTSPGSGSVGERPPDEPG